MGYQSSLREVYSSYLGLGVVSMLLGECVGCSLLELLAEFQNGALHFLASLV